MGCKMSIKVTVNVECPRVPNFLKLGREVSIDIKEFSDDELREIGQQWTIQLLKTAHQRRKQAEAQNG